MIRDVADLRPQRGVELGIVVKIATLGDPLSDLQALQNFRLRCHHCFGRRIGAKNAFQFAHLVVARVVDQRTRGGVSRSGPLDRDPGAPGHKHRDQQECPKMAAKDTDHGTHVHDLTHGCAPPGRVRRWCVLWRGPGRDVSAMDLFHAARMTPCVLTGVFGNVEVIPAVREGPVNGTRENPGLC